MDRSAASRKEALAAAMRIVLVKLTGDRQAPDSAAMQPVLSAAESYVQQDQYREATRSVPGGSGAPARELTLWVRFDETALDRDIRAAGIPIWESERPSTLVWLTLSDTGGPSFITPDDHPELFQVVDQRVQSRGLSLVLPLLDLQDTESIHASDVAGGVADPVLEASRRYQADSILAGDVSSPSSGIWEGRWTAYLGGTPVTWTSEGDLPELVIEEGIDRLGDELAQHYMQASGGSGIQSVELTVSDVTSADGYARALRYLSNLSSVKGVQVTRVAPGQVTFFLSVHGGAQAIAQAISLGRTLQPAAGGQYRLLP